MYELQTRIFETLVSLSSMWAWACLWVSFDGLYGNKAGLTPLGTAVDEQRICDKENLKGMSEWKFYLYIPSIFYWFPRLAHSDFFLKLVIVGCFSLNAAVLLFDLPAIYALTVSWFFYGSLDILEHPPWMKQMYYALILNTQANYVFGTFLNTYVHPSMMAMMLRLLIWRLWFSAGLLKVLAREAAWLPYLTAMDYHHWSQPLPTVFGCLLNRLPHWFHVLETVGTLVIEIILPQFCFLDFRYRTVAAIIFSVLGLMISISGIFGWVGFLLTAQCLIGLVDDGIIEALLRFDFNYVPKELPAFNWLSIGLLVIFSAISLIPFRDVWNICQKDTKTQDLVQSFYPPILIQAFNLILESKRMSRFNHIVFLCWRGIINITHVASRWHLISSYFLFAGIQKRKYVITFEGSDDGVEWKEYDYSYCPGKINRRPPTPFRQLPMFDREVVALIREVLMNRPPPRWFFELTCGLLKGRFETVNLFGENPFEKKPPKFVRTMLWDYILVIADYEKYKKFDEWYVGKEVVEKWETSELHVPKGPQDKGNWWRRKHIAVLYGPVQLEDVNKVLQEFDEKKQKVLQDARIEQRKKEWEEKEKEEQAKKEVDDKEVCKDCTCRCHVKEKVEKEKEKEKEKNNTSATDNKNKEQNKKALEEKKEN